MSNSFFDSHANRLLEVLGLSSPRTRQNGWRRRALRFGPELLEDRTLLTTVTVNIVNFAFNPDPVTIITGDTIHWVWQTSNHSTTSVVGDPESWDSGVHSSGFTFDHTFTHAGKYAYYCSIHGFDNGDGTAGGMSGTITVNQSAPTLTSIAVTPANPSVPKGETEQFVATGTYSDNSTKDITNTVTWASATTSVATINATGLATAVAQGTSNITATLTGVSGSTVMTVSAAVLQSIAVTPANPSVPKGETQQFTATGTFSDKSTQDITSTVTWASATTSVATINTTGLATAVAQGTSKITASLNAVSGSTTMTVSAAALQSITVTPASPSVPNGETQQFTATGTFSDNSTQNLTNSVTWASATTSVATINAAGLATAVAQGTSKITASLNGVSGSTTMTVSPAVLQSIAVTPANPSVAKGLTEQFTATGTFSDHSTQDLTDSATWSSGTTSVATINSSGLATTLATGSSTISATFSGVTGSTSLTVAPAALVSIAVSPANPRIVKGQTQQFTATGNYTDSSTQDLTNSVAWSSDTPSVATINAAGLATSVTPGNAKISATLSGVTGSTKLNVTAGILVSIAITPVNPTVNKGETEQFVATGTFSDSSTQDISSSVTWTTGTSSVATISATGLASTLAQGTTSVTASLNGISGSTTLTVNPAALVSIAVGPANPSIVKGQTQQFTATGTFTDNSTQDLTSVVTWNSATPSVATINAAGLATAIVTGTSKISASMNGISGSTVMTVKGIITPINDYNGLGKSELAVFRPSTAQWFALGQTTNHLLGTFGALKLTDIPVPGDYDGVGHTELAVFRPSTAQWFVMDPVTGKGRPLGTFGAKNLVDLSVPGDYDGIGRTELAVFRPSTAQWFVMDPVTGKGRPLGTFGAKNLTDIPVPGDYDGIGRTELAVFRPSTAQWFVMNPTTGKVRPIGTFGASNLVDIPLPGDYDGVGHVELAVFRPAMAQWIVQDPVTGKGRVLGTFGTINLADVPLSGLAAVLKALGKLK
jgi:plastocyanin